MQIGRGNTRVKKELPSPELDTTSLSDLYRNTAPGANCYELLLAVGKIPT